MEDRRVLDPVSQQEVVIRDGETAAQALARFRKSSTLTLGAPLTLRRPYPSLSGDERVETARLPNRGVFSLFSVHWPETTTGWFLLLMALFFVAFSFIFAGSSFDQTWATAIGMVLIVLVFLPLCLTLLLMVAKAFTPFVNATNGRSQKAQRGSAQSTAPASTSWREAEREAAVWMRQRGATNAAETRGSRDYGTDITSDKYAAQVKDWASNVGAPAVREIHGAALADGKKSVFFARRGYTVDALRFAEQAGVALFVKDTAYGYKPVSTAAKTLYKLGF